MIFGFIEAEKANHPIALMCKIFGVTRAGYYAFVDRDIAQHETDDFELIREIAAAYEESRHIYGAPRIHEALKRKGIRTSRKRIARLMRENDIQGVSKRKRKPKQKASRPEQDNAIDLVKRNFSAKGPDQIWFADITYVKTYQGWLYLAVVFDVWSRKVVGWSMDDLMEARLVDDALRMGIKRRNPPAGLIHHSDHGSQYRSLLLGRTLRINGIVPSMGAISSPWDNAVTESLMSTIKSECTDETTFKTREDARLAIFDYIEVFYNRIRMHSALGYLSPEEFETSMRRSHEVA